jgi:hypothetical protein
MKVTVEVDCTPDEARAFFGLPDVKPMQEAVMSVLEKQAVQAVDHASPDAMLRLWFTTWPQMSTQMGDMFGRMMTAATGTAPSAKS